MAYSGAGAGAAAAHAAMVQATKASGAIVEVEPDAFLMLLSKTEKPLVVAATGGTFKRNYQYLTAYRGLIFYTKSPSPLELGKVELVSSRKIWVPS